MRTLSVLAPKSLKAKNLIACTPLHYAAKANNDKAIEFLIIFGAEVNAVDKCGQTPAHYAAKLANSDAYRKLRDLNVNLNIADVNGDTPSLLYNNSSVDTLAYEDIDSVRYHDDLKKTHHKDSKEAQQARHARTNENRKLIAAALRESRSNIELRAEVRRKLNQENNVSAATRLEVEERQAQIAAAHELFRKQNESAEQKRRMDIASKKAQKVAMKKARNKAARIKKLQERANKPK